jgi:hypothetical protein
MSFSVAGQGTLILPVEAAGGGAGRRPRVRRRCASVIEMNELKAKTKRSNTTIMVRFMV